MTQPPNSHTQQNTISPIPADQPGILGFGKRIIVPPDEVHSVIGEGWHSMLIAKNTSPSVYGAAAEAPSDYWLNPLTQVIKLKTTAFNINLHNPNQQGLELLDKNQLSFLVWAIITIKLNVHCATQAVQRVGNDLAQLVHTVKDVGQSELRATAVTLSLEDIINDSTLLAYQAAQNIQHILKELGYDIVLLSITRINGVAYQKLIELAEARLSKETTIAINREQMRELESHHEREYHEAHLKKRKEQNK